MLHMQRIMIEKLNCSNWDEVVQYHPDSSKPYVLEKYMLLFANTVSCSPWLYFLVFRSMSKILWSFSKNGFEYLLCHRFWFWFLVRALLHYILVALDSRIPR